MDTPSNHHRPLLPFATPAQQALNTLAGNTENTENTEKTMALDTLAGSEVLVPVPDDASEEDARDPAAVALPVLEQPGGEPVVPVFTSELEMAELLPFVSRYRLVPLGALASQWPSGDLSLTIDASSPHRLTLDSEGVRTLLARPRM
ncbi:SseB family protein [Streptomyces sp. NBC_01136]|uniref:SseB family protein n=1 Tax=unclassified Streptomyces TaxID=2593676 RepID=UPI003254367E|nr:SseB family protein [Streptomyces sp. NBC_01136]